MSKGNRMTRLTVYNEVPSCTEKPFQQSSDDCAGGCRQVFLDPSLDQRSVHRTQNQAQGRRRRLVTYGQADP